MADTSSARTAWSQLPVKGSALAVVAGVRFLRFLFFPMTGSNAAKELCCVNFFFGLISEEADQLLDLCQVWEEHEL